MVGKESAIREFDQVERLVVWHAFDLDILRAARDLMARSHVRGRDAVHAATALAAGFDTIVSTDRDFDGIPGLTRRDPRDSARTGGKAKPASPGPGQLSYCASPPDVRPNNACVGGAA